ncbi:non-ribosomal peptide synthetase [Rhodococcus opacus]|uniref:Phenyloxazoline synthase MbtB n=1 Tax=Rhodococcus opacus (strain B4) TaxID=632772 RepID=C1B2E7_RHOOB|nr:non-ribosomal peptide synthetase [Rhodococcus opacus]BAH50571.1 non-ribosomal peptide synthetase [Rhodococcus opacus B4]
MGSARISTDDIREVVSQQLGIPAERIEPGSDLIGLGLDSIRMMKLAGGWRKRGFDVNFAELAAHPSVEQWCELLGRRAPREPAARPDGSAPIAAGEAFPLAPMQHAYWVGRSEGQELGGVAAHLYVEFDGPALDPVALAGAVDALVAHHPMLRAQFLPDGTQRILALPGRPVFTVVDLRDRSDDDVSTRLDGVRDMKTHQRLAVEDGQVLDITLSRLPGGRARLHLDVDMLAADAMSYRILVDDLARLYGGGELPATDYSFRYYLERSVAHTVPKRDRDWWRSRLADLPAAPALPVVPEAERVDPCLTVRYHHWLDASAKSRLLAESHRRGVTPAMALASVFAEVIGRWSTEPRFLLNLPLFHREDTHPDVERLVGDFTSSVLLEVDLRDTASVSERAEALQRAMHAAGAHAAYTGLDVLRDLGRSRGEPVLAPVVYTSALNLGELFSEGATDIFGEPVWIISQGPQVLLDAQVTEVSGGLLLNWDVRTSAFRPGVIDAMFARYTAAVDRLADAGFWTARAAPALPADQRETRTRVNATTVAVPRNTLHEGFFGHAAVDPGHPAVLWGADGCSTYGELADRALRVGAALTDAGVGAGDAVAVQLPQGPVQIVAVLGVLAAGGVYVPVGFHQPEARRARILATAGVVAAITTDPATFDGTGIPALAVEAAATHPSPLPDPARPDPEELAYVLFTSGSTGTPKGVEVPHRAAMNTIADLNARFEIGAADRCLAVSALEFDLSVYDLFGLLSAGGTVVAVDDANRQSPDGWVDAVRRHGVTVLNCVPSILDMMLSVGGDALAGSLRVVIVGGDVVGVDLPRRVAAQLPGCRFAGLGGTTETAIHSTICEVVEPPDFWRSVPYGTPLGNVQCRVVNTAGLDCPEWVAGELWIGGDGVARGYRGDPERSADRFVAVGGQRWYRTGDLARYWPDGTLEFLGRADHQVQIRGYRIELGEVEAALRSLPPVHLAVAAIVGTTTPKLAAAVTISTTPASDLAGQLAALLPAQMIPERIVTLETFPLTPNGKLDRRALWAVLDDDGAATPAFVAPRTSLEAALADVVGTVLERREVGASDDFFALGGDSVLATTAIARIRDWLDAPHATVADIFAARTVAELAHRLDANDAVPGRLERVAEVYLEVAGMDDEEIATREAADRR